MQILSTTFASRPRRALSILTAPCVLAALLALSGPAAAGTVQVQQVANSFAPQDIVINEGDTVVWQWSFGVHTVSEGTDGVVNGNEAFHSPLTSGTQTFSVVFDAAFLAANPRPNNRYDYFCEPHFILGMVGSVTVCAPAPSTYCTAKASSIPGCVPTIAFSGVPSLGLGSGFDVTAGPTPGGNPGLFIYTTQGAASTPVQNPYGFLCVKPSGLFRIAIQNGGGSQGTCSGQYSVDFVAHALT